MQYSEFKHQSVLTRIVFQENFLSGFKSEFSNGFSLYVSNYVVYKIIFVHYPGTGFVIGFRSEDLVFPDVATCNLVEVYGNFRGICRFQPSR